LFKPPLINETKTSFELYPPTNIKVFISSSFFVCMFLIMSHIELACWLIYLWTILCGNSIIHFFLLFTVNFKSISLIFLLYLSIIHLDLYYHQKCLEI
jgi:hypothetical protein